MISFNKLAPVDEQKSPNYPQTPYPSPKERGLDCDLLALKIQKLAIAEEGESKEEDIPPPVQQHNARPIKPERKSI